MDATALPFLLSEEWTPDGSDLIFVNTLTIFTQFAVNPHNLPLLKIIDFPLN